MSGSTTIRDTTLVDRPGRHDVTLRDGRIAAIEPHQPGSPPPAGSAIDGSGLLTLPGICNAHLHSAELPLRGRIHGLPQELYNVMMQPLRRAGQLPPPEQIYAITRAACVEMLRNGTTMVVDDAYHHSPEHLDAALRAYTDSGLRARVTVHLRDRPWTESVAYIGELLDDDVAAEVAAIPIMPVDDALAFAGDAIRRWRARGDRVGCIIAPSAPQRCTPELLRGAHELAASLDVPIHLHVQETMMQAAAGPLRFDATMVGYMDRLGILDRRTTVVHGVWLNDDDVELIAERGASVVHNPTSNLKLGSGIAPVRRLLDAGVNVALGCDGFSCNDSQDVFEAMKTALLLSTVRTTRYEEWLTPAQVFELATRGGPRANLLDDVGGLAPGQRADLVLVDRRAPGLRPLADDAVAQAVLLGDGRHTDTVIVDGRVLVRKGRLMNCDEEAVLARGEEASRAFLEVALPAIERMAPRLMPAHRVAYARSRELLATSPALPSPPPVIDLAADRDGVRA